MRIKLTKTAIERIPAPAAGRTTVYDTEEPGLAVQITSNDSRTFYVVRKRAGRVVWVRLGALEDMTLDQARRAAAETRADLRKGVDVNAIKRQDRDAATLGGLWEAYRTDHLVNKKPGSAKEFTRLYDAHLAPWKNRPLSEINKDECRALHKKIGASSKYTANRVLAIISAMFRAKGEDFGLADDWTPTTKIKRYDEEARDRTLSPEELAAALNAIDADENELVRDYFRMMLYTGSRKTKLAEMSWQQISLQRRTWTVPGALMKNGSPLVVILVDDAVSILERRAENNPSDSPYVFPARLLTAAQVEAARALHSAGKSTRQIAGELHISQTGATQAIKPEFTAEAPRPFNGAAKAWERILKRAGITTRTTPHDLRRTYVTNLLESGAALMHVAAAVGHRSTETTQKHYAVARQDKVADAVRAGVASMMSEAAAAGAKIQQKKIG